MSLCPPMPSMNPISTIWRHWVAPDTDCPWRDKQLGVSGLIKGDNPSVRDNFCKPGDEPLVVRHTTAVALLWQWKPRPLSTKDWESRCPVLIKQMSFNRAWLSLLGSREGWEVNGFIDWWVKVSPLNTLSCNKDWSHFLQALNQFQILAQLGQSRISKMLNIVMPERDIFHDTASKGGRKINHSFLWQSFLNV